MIYRMTRKKRGFTLVEIMVVVIVLGILAAFVIPNLFSQTEQAKVAKARSEIGTLETMLHAFRMNMNRYPTQEEGLDVLRVPPSSDDANLWKGPYAMKDLPLDPWGVPYQYLVPAPNQIDEFGIVSYGKDRAPGGEGDARDICSWEDYDNPAGGGAADGTAPAAGGAAAGGAAPAGAGQ